MPYSGSSLPVPSSPMSASSVWSSSVQVRTLDHSKSTKYLPFVHDPHCDKVQFAS